MKLYSWLALVGLLICAGGCGATGKNWMSDSTIDILSNPTAVEAYRTVQDAPASVKGRSYHGPDVWVVDMYGDFGDRVTEVLFDKSTYWYPSATHLGVTGWKYHRDGVFFPIAGYRFWRGRDWVEVELDFDMDQMVTRTFTDSDSKVEMRSAYFDGSHDKMIDLIQEAFPADPAIRNLKRNLHHQ